MNVLYGILLFYFIGFAVCYTAIRLIWTDVNPIAPALAWPFMFVLTIGIAITTLMKEIR